MIAVSTGLSRNMMARMNEQHQHVAQNGDQAGGEQIVEHVHVGGDAGNQTAHRIAIVEGQVERCRCSMSWRRRSNMASWPVYCIR